MVLLDHLAQLDPLDQQVTLALQEIPDLKGHPAPWDNLAHRDLLEHQELLDLQDQLGHQELLVH